MPNYKSSLHTVLINGEVIFMDFRYYLDGSFELVQDGFTKLLQIQAEGAES